MSRGEERRLLMIIWVKNNISRLFLWSGNFQRASNLCVSASTRGGNFSLKLLEEQFIKIHRVWQPLLIINVISSRDQSDPPRPYKQPSEVYNISCLSSPQKCLVSRVSFSPDFYHFETFLSQLSRK